MQKQAEQWEKTLGRELLKGVSRSFYLSLRMLPARVRGVVSLAYLLARASDTIADTADLPAGKRLDLLERFRSCLEESSAARDSLQEEMAREFIPRQEDPAETALLEALRDCFRWLETLDDFERRETVRVLSEITRGQFLDCQRFGHHDGGVVCLQTADDLCEYTYLVAGCVGGFWTRLGFRKWEEYISDDVEPGTMEDWGIHYGMGLQLVNILRDLPGDLKQGRCYLPADEIPFSGEKLSGAADAAGAALLEAARKWERACDAYLREGFRYVCAVRPTRMRLATALPVFLGLRTLRLLEGADWEARAEGVKVPRPEVKRLMRSLAVGMFSEKQLRKLWQEAGGE